MMHLFKSSGDKGLSRGRWRQFLIVFKPGTSTSKAQLCPGICPLQLIPATYKLGSLASAADWQLLSARIWASPSSSAMRYAMEMQQVVFKNDQIWLNLFVGGELYPVQLRTLLHHDNNGTWFRDRVVRSSECQIKVMCTEWASSPNHIHWRLDIDRDPKVFRYVLQYLRNGKKVALPTERWELQEILCEAEFFGMEGLKYLVKKKLWKLTGKATYFACYSDDSD